MRTLSATIAAILIAAACTATPAPTPTAATDGKVVVTDKTAGELAAVMAKRADSIGRKDLSGFQSTFDTQRPALRRCQMEAFDIQTRQGSRPSAPTVTKPEAFGDTYVRALVGSDANGYQRLYFRKVDGNWRLSEPTESEHGGEKTKTISNMELSYFTLDEDVVDTYAKAGIATRDFVLQQAPTPLQTTFHLRFFPTRTAAGLQQCTVGGTFISGDKYLRLYSNVLYFKSSGTEMHDSMIDIVKHEGLHWLQNQIVPGITARLDEWLSEGWPDFVGNATRENVKGGVICNTTTPTFKQLVDGPGTDPDLPPEIPGQYYSFYNSMVEYVYATYGKQTYFDALVVYKDRVEPEFNYPKIFKVTPQQFYDSWKVWAKQKYRC